MGFPGGSVVKSVPARAGDMGSIPGLGRSPAEGNENPLQYSCLENPMDRGAWRATVHGCPEDHRAMPLASDLSPLNIYMLQKETYILSKPLYWMISFSISSQ